MHLYRFVSSLAALLCLFTAALHGQSGRTVALIVQSKGDHDLVKFADQFQQMVAAELTDQGFEIIDPAVVAQVVGSNKPKEETEGSGSWWASSKEQEKSESLDDLLLNNSTALRLSQNMGASYIAHASLLSFNQRKTHVTAYGMDTLIVTNTLRISLKVMEGVKGSSLLGKTLEVEEKEQVTGDSQTIDTGRVERLLLKAARQIAKDMAVASERRGGLAERAAADESSSLEITAVIRGLSVPIVAKDDAGNYTVVQNNFPVEATGVLVQLDGVVIGSAPDTFLVAPGLHSLTMTRDDLKPITRTIKISPKGSKIAFSMELTDEALERWKDVGEFVSNLKLNENVTDAHAERIRGIAQMYRQSGFRIDLHRDGNGQGDVNLDMSKDVNVNQVQAGMNGMGFGGVITGSNAIQVNQEDSE